MFVLLLALGGCGGGESATTPAALVSAEATGVTVETGGMALPAPAAESPAAAATGADQPPTAAATARPVIPIGSVVTAAATAAIYAEPDRAAPRFAEYAAGSSFTIIEPDGDYTAYPVEVDGERWVRVRAEDGLVGWMTEP